MSLFSNVTRTAGNWFDKQKGYVWHYVGAAANVFLQNQSRLGRIWSFFESSGIWDTLGNFLFWLSIPAASQGFRARSIQKRETLIDSIGESLTPDEAAALIVTFGSYWAHTWDVLGAAGEGVKMMNVFPLPITLLDVYCNILGPDGSIDNEHNGIFGVYFTTLLISAGLFASSEYSRNRTETEKQTERFLEKIHTSLAAQSPEKDEPHVTELFRRKYHAAETSLRTQGPSIIQACLMAEEKKTNDSNEPLLGSDTTPNCRRVLCC